MIIIVRYVENTKTTPTRSICRRRVVRQEHTAPAASTMMVEVKSYLSRVLAPVDDFRVSPWNFDGGPHADTPVHYPLARH